MRKILFFIEGEEHFRFISPYIEILDSRDYEIKIVTLGNLPLKNLNYTKILRKNIKTYFNQLDADFLITTTPGVGSFYFPKNNKTKYIYVFHSLVSPNEIYLKNSFKHFDIIFSPNNIISEQLKNLTSKNSIILTVGYPLLNNNYYIEDRSTNENSILIAPSWGKNSLINERSSLEGILDNLLENNFNITFRPHPMELNNIHLDIYKDKIDLDLNKDLKNLLNYKYLITDWSGIALEFSLIKKHKSIYLDLPKKTRRKTIFNEKKEVLIEDRFRKNYGLIIEKDSFFQISNLITFYNDWNIFNDEYIENLTNPKFSNLKVKKIFEQIFV